MAELAERAEFMKRKSTGTNVIVLAAGSSRSKKAAPHENLPPYPFYAICVENGQDYNVFLQLGKPYKVIRPHKYDRDYDFRVIDEEGEDYLYPRRWFVPIALEPKQRRRLAAALTTVS